MNDKDNKFVNQSVFKQLIDLLPKNKFDRLASDRRVDHYSKTFSAWTQLLTMLFGILSRCDSTAQVTEGLQASQGQLNHFGLDCAPAKSTFGDALRRRDNKFFEEFYLRLLTYYKPVLSACKSKMKNVSFKQIFLFDSTTISLFSSIMRGAGRNPQNEGRKKGGLKVHMLIDAHAESPVFATISEAVVHDKHFIKYLTLPAYSMIVFDRAYNHYQQFAEFTERGINFVCRLKVNAVYQVQQIIFSQELPEKQSGILKEEHIHLTYTKEKIDMTLCLRKVTYRDDKGNVYEFITNNFEITNEEVAHIYKLRWGIELMFKKLKQNFQLHYFYSESENGIRTQIWCTLIAQLLLLVLKAKSETIKAFSTVAAIVRIHWSRCLDIFWLIENSSRTYAKTKKPRNKSPGIQTEMF